MTKHQGRGPSCLLQLLGEGVIAHDRLIELYEADEVTHFLIAVCLVFCWVVVHAKRMKNT